MRHKWRIYYSDGSTFDNKKGKPSDAPSYGFICAVGYDEAGNRYIMHGWDYYCYDVDSNQWWGMDIAGLFDRLANNKVHAFKMGRTVTKSDFQKIMQKAHEDSDFKK